LEIAKNRFPRHDANIVADFSLPLFETNFSEGKIVDSNLDTELRNKVKLFKAAL
jgi:hypothetical protein